MPTLCPASPSQWFPGRSREEWEDPAAASRNLPDTYSVFICWGATFPSSVFLMNKNVKHPVVLLWDNQEQTKEPGFCDLTWAHPSPQIENNKNTATNEGHPREDMPHTPDRQGSAPGCGARPGEALSGRWAFMPVLAPGTALVVQRPRLRAPSAGHPGLIPGQGTRSHVWQLEFTCLN